MALTTFVQGEAYDTATALIDAGLDFSRRQGLAARQGVLHGQRAVLALARGALDDAQLEAETGLALIGERHATVLQLAAVAIAVYVERGDLEAAKRALERGVVFGDTEDRIYLEQYLTSRGRLRIASGQVREGVQDLLWCGERLAALGLRWPSSWRAFAVPALVSLGEEQRAVELANEQIELTRRVGVRGALGARPTYRRAGHRRGRRRRAARGGGRGPRACTRTARAGVRLCRSRCRADSPAPAARGSRGFAPGAAARA